MARTHSSGKTGRKPQKPLKTKKSANPSWFSKIWQHKMGRPALFMAAFAIIGTATILISAAASVTYGVWTDSARPRYANATETKSVELGMKFKSNVAGYITGVRFYKGPENTGTHTGSLWNSSGKLLATVTFSNEKTSGWQSATFDTPVSVAANVTYIVSYHAPKGKYAIDIGYFNNSGHTNDNLTALQATRNQANGVYKFSSQTSFPKDDGSGANYWVDVMFTKKLLNAPVAPAAPGNVVANIQSDRSVNLSWQASSSATGVSMYEIFRSGSKIGSSPSTNFHDGTTQAGKSYDYQVRAIDTAGVASALSAKVTVQIPASDGTGSTSGGSTSGGSTGGSSGSTSSGGNSSGGSGGTSTGDSANLFNTTKKEIAMELVSSAENSSLNWKAQYAYLEDIGDGRGYTGGIIGFCSGTGDMLEMVQYYTSIAPGNILSKYIPALQKVNGTESHTGLGAAFEADWKTAAKDSKFQQAQDYERDMVYFNPAVNQAIADGLHALGQFIYYDAMVMHGPGNDPVSFGGIRATALKKAKTPAQGGSEATYLNAFLDARKAAMLTEAAHDNTDRVDTEQRVFLNAGNLNLDPPLKWSTYGDSYSILTNPAP